MLCYVTAFLDLNRENWNLFSRSIDTYFEHFSPMISLFELYNTNNYKLIVFLDEKHIDKFKIYFPKEYNFLILVPINRNFLNTNSVIWSRLEKEKEIMNSCMYKSRFQHRLQYPENSNPEYTLINHAKIDFIDIAIQLLENSPEYEYFCWVDFGYFQNKNRISNSLIDIKKINSNCINYTLINDIEDKDRYLLYTMHTAPERVGGFFFIGKKDQLKQYQKIYHDIHERFQKLGLADDDQHLVLRCYFENQNLFCFHNLGEWHKALLYFSNDC